MQWLTMNNQYKQLIDNYIKAKDTSKPVLMAKTFTDSAKLNMEVNSAIISFPSDVIGCEAITNTLVREFNNSYDNIYTVCLSDTVTEHESQLDCLWFVGMTEKNTGVVRVGFGRYQWCFTDESAPKVKQLTIVIEAMEILTADLQVSIVDWLDSIEYPWTGSDQLLSSMPEMEELTTIRHHMISLLN